MDIYTYIARGKVFANTQTGNLVLLGMNVAEGKGHKAWYYVLPILAFMLGVGLAEWIEHKYEEKRTFRWLHVTLGLEIVILLIVMFVPGEDYNVIEILLVSFIVVLHVQNFLMVQGNSYYTTIFYGIIKNAAERF